MQNIRLWFTLWAVLCFIALPVSFQFLPTIGNWLSTILLPLTRPLSLVLFATDVRYTYHLSDSAAIYSTALVFWLCSLILTIGVSCFLKRHFFRIQSVMYYSLLYFVIFYLLRYGLDKWVGNQFYTPASNTLHTPLGQLSKDILFWSSMGTSHHYNLFMAGSELMAAILLIFRRTRFFGLLISLGVLINVFAINIGFDISVKYLSGLLVLSTVLLLSYHVDQLSLLFRSNLHNASPFLHFQHTNRSLLLKSIILTLICTELMASFWSAGPARSSGHSYLVTYCKGRSGVLDLPQLKRIHIHPQGYLITETKDQEFKSHDLILREDHWNIDGQPVHFESNKLSWVERRDTIHIELQEINLNALPAKQDKTHWTVEVMMENPD